MSGMETQLGAKGYALGVFNDIEGEFDSTSKKSIKEAMTKREALVNWIQNMLTNKNLTVNFGTVLMEECPAGECP